MQKLASFRRHPTSDELIILQISKSNPLSILTIIIFYYYNLNLLQYRIAKQSFYKKREIIKIIFKTPIYVTVNAEKCFCIN